MNNRKRQQTKDAVNSVKTDIARMSSMDEAPQKYIINKDGTIIDQFLPFDQLCGQKLVACKNDKCEHKTTCRMFEPDLDFQKIVNQYTFEELESHTHYEFFTPIEIPKCSVCQSRKECKNVKIAHRVKACKNQVRDNEEFVKALKEIRARMFQILWEDYSDFRALARLIRDSNSGKMDAIDKATIRKFVPSKAPLPPELKSSSESSVVNIDTESSVQCSECALPISSTDLKCPGCGVEFEKIDEKKNHKPEGV